MTTQPHPTPQLRLRATGYDETAFDWGANCGPTALAGALGLLLADVREAVSPGGKFPGRMSITAMKQALGRLGARAQREWSRPAKDELARTGGRMTLVCIVWGGPWVGGPYEAHYRHFITYAHGYFGPVGPGWVCDVNNGGAGWLPFPAWEESIVPLLLPRRKDESLRGDGSWLIQWMATVER